MPRFITWYWHRQQSRSPCAGAIAQLECQIASMHKFTNGGFHLNTLAVVSKRLATSPVTRIPRSCAQNSQAPTAAPSPITTTSLPLPKRTKTNQSLPSPPQPPSTPPSRPASPANPPGPPSTNSPPTKSSPSKTSSASSTKTAQVPSRPPNSAT